MILATTAVCLLLYAFLPQCVSESDDGNSLRRLEQWFVENGGYMSPKIEHRLVDPNDATSLGGTYANQDIEPGETIYRLPIKLAITTDESISDKVEPQVQLIENLYREYLEGDDAPHAPYVQYIFEKPPNQLPSTWSIEGKELFHELLKGDDGFGPLPPYDEATKRVPDLMNLVLEESSLENVDTKVLEHAVTLMLQRNWHGSILMPVIDMTNHRNGHYHNVVHMGFYDVDAIEVRATRFIERGEQLYDSYNRCRDCDNHIGQAVLFDEYSTAGIFKDHGFVESLPQRWYFEDLDFGFDVIQSASSSDLRVQFFKEPNRHAYDYMQYHLERLRQFETSILRDVSSSVSREELGQIQTFRTSLDAALEAALQVTVDRVSGSGSRLVKAKTSAFKKTSYKGELEDLVRWIGRRGGYFSEKLEIVKAADGSFSVIARDDINVDERLYVASPHVSIKPEHAVSALTGSIRCGLTASFMMEMHRHGSTSDYWPLMRLYFEGNLTTPIVPSLFSDSGKRLLEFMLDSQNEESNRLWPEEPFQHADYWENICHGNPQQLQWFIASSILEWDNRLLPLLDVFRHRNGHETNARFDAFDDHTTMRATQHIRAGKEIFISRNLCLYCGEKRTSYGTSEIFRDYGFVESFPQRWYFGEVTYFDLDRKPSNVDDEAGSTDLEVQIFDYSVRDFQSEGNLLSYHLQRLQRMEGVIFSANLPDAEEKVMEEFRSAVMSALSSVLATIDVHASNGGPLNATEAFIDDYLQGLHELDGSTVEAEA